MAFVYVNANRFLNEDYWLNTPLKVVLVGPGYVADRSDVFASAFAGSEADGTGYTAGFGSPSRKALTAKAVTLDAANNRYLLEAADLVYPGLDAGQIHAAVIIEEVTSDADSPVIGYLDGLADKTPTGDQLTVALSGGAALALVSS